MAFRRNLRDIALVLVLAALCYLSVPQATEPVPARLTINGFSLGDPVEKMATSGLEGEFVPFSQSCFFSSKDGRLLIRSARPEAGVTQLEGDRLEWGGQEIAGPGTSREMVVHHLGRPSRSRPEASDGLMEDYYSEHDLMVRYRGYQLEKVWMVDSSQAWFDRGNWPEPLSDYR